MSSDQDQGERAWEADKRDFVADWRDEIAARRDADADAWDAMADEREHLADERESELEEAERRIHERAAALGLPPERSAEEKAPRAAARAAAAAQRRVARQERDQAHDERDAAAAARDAAAKRRQASAPATGLALAFAEIARYLYEAGNFDDVLTRIVESTVSTVAGCDMASITAREDRETFRTLAATHAAATAVDEAQYQAHEGPCLDAVEQAMVSTPAFPDPRWPALASRPATAGVQAATSYRLAAPGRTGQDTTAGSLNAYAGTPQAFSDEAQEIGLILAAHASAGMQAVRERETFERLGRQLHEALSSRDVIGQAKGILMERLQITPEDAFDTLRRSSQQLNVKLREVAQRLTETGEFNDPAGN